MPTRELVHAFKWSLASEIAAKAIQPVVFIVLARLLMPEDFGVMSAALMVIGFSQIFWEAGMSKALIQRQTAIEDAANVAFWINIGLGVVVALLLFVAAGPIAQTVFHDPRVTAVLQVMTLQVFLGALSSVHTALLQKDMGFKKLFWVRFATVSLPGLASIPLAWNGMDYWALVAGTLVGQTTQVVMLWHMSRWRPSMTFRLDLAQEMGRFGAWVGASGLLAWFYVWADALVVGMYLGSHELGLYQTGNQFAGMIFALVFGPIVPVLYSHCARMNGDQARLRHIMERAIKTIIVIAIPIAFVVFSLSEPAGLLLFGEQWLGIGLVIGVMALMHGYSWIVGMNGEAYRAMGKPALETIVTGSTLAIYLVAYLISIGHGLETFVWTRLTLAIGALLLHLTVLRKVLSLPLTPLLKFMLITSLLSWLITMAVSHIFNSYDHSAWQSVIFCGLIDLAMIFSALYLMERKGAVAELAALFRRGRM